MKGQRWYYKYPCLTDDEGNIILETVFGKIVLDATVLLKTVTSIIYPSSSVKDGYL